MPGMSDIEQRIRRLCDRLNVSEQATKQLADGIGAFEQQVLAAGSLSFREPGCDVTITGQVTTFEWGFDLPDVAVSAWYPDNTGTLIGTAVTDGSGNYSITGSVPVGGTSATIYFSKTRWADEAPTPTITCGSNVWDQIMTAAATYHEAAYCVEPISDSVSLVDSVYGAATLTWAGAGWIGSIAVPGIIYTLHPDPAFGTEPNILTVTSGLGNANSDTSTIGCDPFDYSGSGPGNVALYPTGTGHWTITDP